ncbi:sensor histidine kinase [Spirillospora albida]|uniref:sensor histidine kinase n=1 Tax=Spirillospora albida TaxID=58123 RepID=UPI00068E7754|nr:sensor histidine kinase [Spirillospora albida]
MYQGKSRSSPPREEPTGAATLPSADPFRCPPHADPTAPRDDDELGRRRLRHDIRHELGTIVMLASAVAVADDIGTGSRARVEQLLGETRWLDHLLRRLDEGDFGDVPPGYERIRVDELAAEVVTGMRLATARSISFTGGEAWAHIDPVALWRAVRNVLDNACRLAAGRVDVRVAHDGDRVEIRIDDDGPGFGAAGPAAPRGLASLGLGIVHDLISGYGGALEIRTCELGGARVRMLLPSSPPVPAADPEPEADDWRRHP